ncbi:MAG: hypothetical protein KatS3mg071_1597 [Meiothermus sp.]|nr:MAG: hypothetical protein KatS3mg071_1597 [Meiothermus sp.]
MTPHPIPHPTPTMNCQDTLNQLHQALQILAQAQIERNRAKEALELARATALISGVLGGRNAEEREAQARTSLAAEYERLNHAEETLILAKARAEIARAAFECSLHQKEQA